MKARKVFGAILLVAALVVLGYSGYKFYGLWSQYHESWVKHSQVEKIFREGKDGEISVKDDYWYRMSKKSKLPYDFNLKSLREKNSDCVGWICMDDTNINYAVMQRPDIMEYYLRRDFDENWDIAGTPFLDEENVIGEDLQNYIIYGHRMNDGSMFSDLKYLLDQEFYEKHPNFWLVLHEVEEDEKTGELKEADVLYRCDIFSVRYVVTQEKLWVAFFSDEEDQQGYVEHEFEGSKIQSLIGVDDVNGNIVTLSTCDYTLDSYYGRLLVHAMMTEIKRIDY